MRYKLAAIPVFVKTDEAAWIDSSDASCMAIIPRHDDGLTMDELLLSTDISDEFKV